MTNYLDWSRLPIVLIPGTSSREIQRAIDDLRGGGTVHLDGGLFVVEETIRLPSNVRVLGRGPHETTLRLADGAACHVFTNSDHEGGNENYCFADFSIDGNMEKQEKPADVTTLTFCCGVYLRTVRSVEVRGITALNMRQTGLHFNNCANVRISEYLSRRTGWSGISTSGTDDISIEGEVHEAGLDVLHSGIHLDGGQGAYFRGIVDTVTGNGVMLDSTFREFGLCKIDAKVTRSKRGVALSGDHDNTLANVLITGEFVSNRETGIMISNAAHVVVTDCKIRNNHDYGILLQGRNGGRECVVFHSEFSGNGLDIAELHQSGMNYFFGTTFRDGEKSQLKPSRPGVAGPRSGVQSTTKPLRSTGRSGTASAQDRSFEPARYQGLCAVCGQRSEFTRERHAIRETYRCQECYASLRHRCQAEAILEHYGDGRAVSIAELVRLDSFRALDVYEPGIVGPFRRFFAELPSYQMSYYWGDYPTGSVRRRARNEDLMDLTFPDDRFDLIVTSDIMEHVRHPYRAFREIKRVLEPGGLHIFSIPVLDPLPKNTVYRVDTSGDQDIHLLPPRYHIAGTGGESLVYTDFGEDLVAKLEDEVGVEVELHRTSDESRPELRRVITFIMKKSTAEPGGRSKVY